MLGFQKVLMSNGLLQLKITRPIPDLSRIPNPLFPEVLNYILLQNSTCFYLGVINLLTHLTSILNASMSCNVNVTNYKTSKQIRQKSNHASKRLEKMNKLITVGIQMVNFG
jgi:hypothetical protein